MRMGVQQAEAELKVIILPMEQLLTVQMEVPLVDHQDLVPLSQDLQEPKLQPQDQNLVIHHHQRKAPMAEEPKALEAAAVAAEVVEVQVALQEAAVVAEGLQEVVADNLINT